MRTFEALEPRVMLAGDSACTKHVDEVAAAISKAAPSELLADNVATMANTNAASVLAAAVDPGSTRSTALNLGTLGATQRQSGSVGGADTSDLFKFTLGSQSRVSLALGSLLSDLDLFLYNSSGQLIALSNKGGTAADSISQTLAAGVYYVGVFPYGAASSSYVLTVGATSTAPITPTTPATPTTPTTPTTPVTAFPNVAYFGGSNDWNLNSINAPEVWAQGYKGQGVVVAVVDTGVNTSHPDLISQIWVNTGEIAGNGVDDDRNGFVDDISGWDFASNDNNPTDGNGHGTHVAGTIAADDNGFGATGVAPDAKIMPVRVLDNNGSGTVSAVAAGIRYAAQNGADIINLSLGGGFSSVIQSAIQYAQSLNVLVVVAAGNESASTPSYPARFSASLSNVISVGAYSSSNTSASFSNDVGASGAVQVDAPGVSVYSTIPGNRYAQYSGTSMATPHVAGVAALALSANSSLTASQLRTMIVNGADHAISGSDSRGGIDAALTVAMAVTGQTSTTATTTASAWNVSATQFASGVRSFVPPRGAATQIPTAASEAAANPMFQSGSRVHSLASALSVPDSVISIHDQAMAVLFGAAEVDHLHATGAAGYLHQPVWQLLEALGQLDDSQADSFWPEMALAVA